MPMHVTPILITEMLCLVTYIQLFKWLLSEDNGLHSVILLLLGWFLEIDPVRERLYFCVCVSAPEAINN